MLLDQASYLHLNVGRFTANQPSCRISNARRSEKQNYINASIGYEHVQRLQHLCQPLQSTVGYRLLNPDLKGPRFCLTWYLLQNWQLGSTRRVARFWIQVKHIELVKTISRVVVDINI